MALKDWKKIDNGFKNKINGRILIFKRITEFVREGSWVVDPQTFTLGEHIFDTRIEALKFAKQYMRTH